MRIRRGIYSAQVVLWLMNHTAIARRGHPGGGRITAGPRGSPAVVAELPARAETSHLLTHGWLLPGTPEGARYCADKRARESPAECVRCWAWRGAAGRTSIWPVLKIVVLHEVETALAEEPQWGPMYGPHRPSANKSWRRKPWTGCQPNRRSWETAISESCGWPMRAAAGLGGRAAVNRGARPENCFRAPSRARETIAWYGRPAALMEANTIVCRRRQPWRTG
jgi:hypothetical protein